MKKRIIIGIIYLVTLSSISGCSNKEENDSTTNDTIVEEVLDESTDEGKEDKSEEAESPLDALSERDQKLAGNAIITPYIQIILTNCGKVLSKGENMYGQLGNGERTNTDTWSEVEGLENIVGIYSLGNIGSRMYDENAFGSCYALNSSGELYCWGGNILTPEKVTLFSNIREVKSIGDLYIQCESGEKYIIIPRFNLQHDDTVYSYNSLPDGAELFGYGSDGYLMYTNNQLTYIDVEGLHQYGSGESFDEILALEDKIKNILPLDITEKIENIIPCSYQGFGGATMITDTGSVIGVGYDEGDIVTEYRGGQGIKKASLNYTDFLLFNNGELCASGDNEAGQLGDGTMTDYFDGYLTIDEAYFSDFEYNHSLKRCIALDEDYNVWGWGEGFGVSPEIIVENTDFLREG